MILGDVHCVSQIIVFLTKIQVSRDCATDGDLHAEDWDKRLCHGQQRSL